VTALRPGGNETAIKAWRWLRSLVTGLAVVCGGWIALMGLGLRERLSGYLWSSNRYYLDWGWGIADAGLAVAIGSVLFPRLAWLLVTALAGSAGYDLPGSGLRKWDFWVFGVGGGGLAYLMFVANVKDAPFWPVGLSLIGVYFVLRQRRG
jgi:hypothetical protein